LREFLAELENPPSASNESDILNHLLYLDDANHVQLQGELARIYYSYLFSNGLPLTCLQGIVYHMQTKYKEIKMSPEVHLEKLYKFRKNVKSEYIREDLMFLLAKIDNKITEVRQLCNNG